MAKRFYKKQSKTDQRSTIFLMKNRKGLSTIVVTLTIILLSIVAVGIVWVFANNMIKKQISSSEACYGNYNKITINRQYTCFNKTSATNYNLRFSLSIGDITVDKVIVSVSSGSAVKSYTITNTPQIISGLAMYPSGSSQVNLSSKNAGLTYQATGFGAKIDSIQIAPSIGGNLCEVSDSVSDIEDCNLIF